MQDEEIKRRIAGFKRWHYQFDLKGNLTPIHNEQKARRHEQRKRHFFDPLVGLYGGSLAGKRVLDLASNAGFWSLNAIEAGCDYVLGVEGRQMHVDQANLVFEVKEVGKDRYDFVVGDVTRTDFRQFGEFDVVMCLGLMYHVSKHINLLERISAVNTDLLVIDTHLSTAPGAILELVRQGTDNPMDAVDHAVAMRPTKQAMLDMVGLFGYSIAVLEPDFRDANGEPDWTGANDFRTGARRVFFCSKQTDLSALPAKVEPVEARSVETSWDVQKASNKGG